MREVTRSRFVGGLRAWIGTAAFLLLVTLVASCAPAEGDDGGAQAVGEEPSGVRIVNVQVTTVSPSDFADFIRVTGEAEAFHDVTIAAEESGRIEAFVAEKGQHVERGQPIARLVDDLLQAQVAEGRASARLAAEQHERQRQLWVDEKMGTEIAYLQAKYQAEQAAARLAQLEERLSRTVIVSPVSGVFDEKYVDEGEMATIGTRIARVVATSRVKIAAGIPERFARSVKVGTPAKVWFDIFPGREFEGRIGFVGSTVDPANRTFPIEIVMSNPDRMVKPNMVANIQVQSAWLQDVIVVPQDVVLRAADGYKVFVVEERDGQLYSASRQVRLGATAGNRTVIEEGLEMGDRLITLGHKQVDDGTRVRLVSPDQPTALENR